MKSPSAKIISISLICCSLYGEDRHRVFELWTMNKESQISPHWTNLLHRNAVLARIPYKIWQASLNQTGKRFVFQSDLCLNQIADSVLTGRRCAVCTVNTEASHIWFNQPLYTVIYFEHVLLYLIPNKWIMDAVLQWCGYSTWCDVKVTLLFHIMLVRDLLGGKNTFSCKVAWWVALLSHSKKVLVLNLGPGPVCGVLCCFFPKCSCFLWFWIGIMKALDNALNQGISQNWG